MVGVVGVGTERLLSEREPGSVVRASEHLSPDLPPPTTRKQMFAPTRITAGSQRTRLCNIVSLAHPKPVGPTKTSVLAREGRAGRCRSWARCDDNSNPHWALVLSEEEEDEEDDDGEDENVVKSIFNTLDG